MRWPSAERLLPGCDAQTRRALRIALEAVRAGLRAVDPRAAVTRAVRRTARGIELGLGSTAAVVSATTPLHVLAVGKGAVPMAVGLSAVVRPASLLLVAPRGARMAPTAEWIVGGHPLPNAASFRAGRRALDVARSVRGGELLVLLVSGGASSLLEDPAVPPRDYAATMRRLVRAGLRIEELNAVRKHLSNVKGGRLALEAAARGVPVVALLLSDVPSDGLDTIGSGLAAPDTTTFGEAIAILEKHRELLPDLPRSALRHLRDGAAGTCAETPKPGILPFARVTNAIVASNRTALAAMEAAATHLGLPVRMLPDPLRGEAWKAGQDFAHEVLRSGSRRGTAVVLAGGETTVRVRGRGNGGRNQEFALGAATVLRGKRALVLAFGTDGIDGQSRNAGAVVDGRTMESAERARIDVERVFAASDSAAFFRKVGGAIRTGPTGTNVADVAVGIAYGRRNRTRGP